MKYMKDCLRNEIYYFIPMTIIHDSKRVYELNAIFFSEMFYGKFLENLRLN